MKTVMMMEGLVAMAMVMGEVEVVVVEEVEEVEGVEGVGVAVEVEVPGEARVGLHRHLLLVEDEVVVLGAEGQHHPLHRMTTTTIWVSILTVCHSILLKTSIHRYRFSSSSTCRPCSQTSID